MGIVVNCVVNIQSVTRSNTVTSYASVVVLLPVNHAIIQSQCYSCITKLSLAGFSYDVVCVEGENTSETN